MRQAIHPEICFNRACSSSHRREASHVRALLKGKCPAFTQIQYNTNNENSLSVIQAPSQDTVAFILESDLTNVHLQTAKRRLLDERP